MTPEAWNRCVGQGGDVGELVQEVYGLRAENARLKDENKSLRNQMEEGKQDLVMEILRLRGKSVSFPESKTEPIGGKGEPVS